VTPPPKPLPALHRLAPDRYYGWFIAFGLAAMSSVVVGIGFYGMAVFLDALASARLLTRAQASLATTLYFVATGVGGWGIGRSVDRYGSRRWIAAGAPLMAVALVALGRVDSFAQVLAVYLLLALGFSMIGNVPTSAILTRWFVAQRARALSIAQTGVSIGGVVLVPLTVGWVRTHGLGAATAWLGALVLGVGWPICAWVLRADPRDHGLAPDGREPGAPALPAALQASESRVWTRREALRTRCFWLLVGAFSAILFCQVGTAMHQLSLLRESLDAKLAALAVSTTAAGSFAARLAVGGVADRLDKRRLAAGLMALQGAAVAGFSWFVQAPPLFACALIFGVTIGNVFLLQALLVAELFGARSFATTLGLLQLITQTASGLGPFALGLLHDALGGYARALRVLAALAVVAALLVRRVQAPEPPAPARAS